MFAFMFDFLENLFCSFFNVMLIAICHLFLVLCKVVSVGATEETKQKHHNWNGKKLKLVHVVGKFIYIIEPILSHTSRTLHYCNKKSR